jgi:cell wall-associated NlpC family hydrolase
VPSTLARFVRRILACAACVLALLLTTGVAIAAPDAADAPARGAGVQVADLAQQYVGSPYRWGGISPTGFDCSGFVMFIYSQFGISLPHNETGQLNSGPRIGSDDLEPGDIVVFANTYRAGLSHTGIYIGDGQFVHAADEQHGVLVSNIWDSYWSPRFVAAARALN